MIGTRLDKELNSLELRFRGKDDALCEEVTQESRVHILREPNGALAGVRIFDAYTLHELIGLNAEDRFQKFIEDKGYSSLYIGQGYGGKEYSRRIRDSGGKRPDFLVNIPDAGGIFVDVKCPRVLGVPGNDNLYFPISADDIDRLFSLQQQILIPVWVGFALRDEDRFFMAPIAHLKRFGDALSILCGDAKRALGSLRIPDGLVNEWTDGFVMKPISEAEVTSLASEVAADMRSVVAWAEGKLVAAARSGCERKQDLAKQIPEHTRYLHSVEVERIARDCLPRSLAEYRKNNATEGTNQGV